MTPNRETAYLAGIAYGSLPKVLERQMEDYGKHVAKGGRPYRLDKFTDSPCCIHPLYRVIRVDPVNKGNHQIIVAWWQMKLRPGDIFVNGAICGSAIRPYVGGEFFFRPHQKVKVNGYRVELIPEIDREYYDAVLEKYGAAKTGRVVSLKDGIKG